jgi:hypothetical protein
VTTDSKPKRLLVGRPRLAIARWQLTISAIPLAVCLLVVLVGLAVRSYASMSAGLFAVAALIARGDVWARRVWWRALWPYDARAGGLVALAETGLNLTYDGPQTSVEAAPLLLAVRTAGPIRELTIRPLPGQTLTTFEQAAEPLRWRWKAETVTAFPHPTRRGLIVLEVIAGKQADLSAPRRRPARVR